jgi:23S rRNA (adenine2503-C2)-methyltransferase
MAAKADIRKLSREDLESSIKELGHPRFRAKQVWQWIWQHGVRDFEEMSNVPKKLRDQLAESFAFFPISIETEQVSSDGTVKCRFALHDGHLIEGVLIPTTDRMTACVSSQVGCSLSCSFCATGFLPLKRNLEAAEIVDQVRILNQKAEEHHGKHLTNIVYMGMGEPLLNYKRVLESTELISAEDGLHMSPKRITVSTAGIAKMIKKLGDDEVRFNLALSLHQTTDEDRARIMPINESNSLESLIDALRYFYSKTRGRITLEYVLLQGVNDRLDDARRLVNICRQIPGARVNIIEYNPVDGTGFEKTAQKHREEFINILERNRVTAKVRRSRGKDIDAACGQLAGKN